MPFARQAYLDRLGMKEAPAGIAGLRGLQASFMSRIPFENIDPLLGQIPSLALEDLQEKLIHGRRGGYCFELNALFGAALQDFGYRPATLLARVRNGAAEGGARMHQAFVVPESGREWLVDVGFGGPGSVWPLDLSEEAPQEAPNGTYRIRFDAAFNETVVERAQGETWLALYGFDRVPVRPIDLEAANHLAATWSRAPFSTHLMMARHGEDGRTTLFNRKVNDGGTSRILSEPAELVAVLAERFDLELPRELTDALWSKIRNAPTDRPS